MNENTFGVPAGWYPDPLGLPQLRWWDAQAWTEHTSEVRGPVVLQPSTRVGFADDDASHDLPSRRERRERERRESAEGLAAETADESTPESSDDAEREVSAQPLLAMTLKELEPPAADTVDDGSPEPRRASTHTNAAPAESTLTALADEVEAPRAATAPAAPTVPKKTYTFAVWAIALMPILQVVASILLIAVLGLGHNLPLLVVVWAAPIVLVLGLAAYDRLVLQTRGFDKPASAFWALLGQPGYLIARAVRTRRVTRKGFATLGVWGAAVVAVLASVLVLPGLAIAAVPQAFASEVESSVSTTAATLGAEITVDCPATPPLLVGEVFTCRAEKPSGDTDSILVSLQRANGWISWQVEDWGIWVLTD